MILFFIRAAALAFAMIWLSGCHTSAAYGGASLYYGFSLVDPDAEKTTENAFVIVKDGRIVEAGSGRLPRGTFVERRDFSGLYATPGLFDTHAHLTLGPISFDPSEPSFSVEYSPAITTHNARMLLAYGITTVRNPGGDAAVNTAYRDGVERGEIVGPKALIAGPVIDRTPIPFHGLAEIVSPERPIETIVAEQAAAGVDAIKLYFYLTKDDVCTGVAAAHAHDKPAIGHLGISWKKAADCGIDAIVHAMPASAEDLEPSARADYLKTARPGSFAFFEWWERADLNGPVMKELIRTLAEKKTHVDLTLIAFYLAFWGDDLSVRDEFISLAHPEMAEQWLTVFRFDAGWRAGDYQRARAVWPKIEAFAKALHEAGVPLTLGTDQQNPFVAPGASLVQEMMLHERAGVPHWAILRMATSDAARVLGLAAKTGRIANGLDADIVFTAGNPAQDLGAFHSVRFVLSNGVLHDADALKAFSRQDK